MKFDYVKNTKNKLDRNHIWLITKLKNALKSKKVTLTIEYSRLNLAIIHTLKIMDLIDGFLIKKTIRPVMIILLKYDYNTKSVISDLSYIGKSTRLQRLFKWNLYKNEHSYIKNLSSLTVQNENFNKRNKFNIYAYILLRLR
jgi:hypothetical protein